MQLERLQSDMLMFAEENKKQTVGMCVRVSAAQDKVEGMERGERASWKEEVAGSGTGLDPCLHRMYRVEHQSVEYEVLR